MDEKYTLLTALPEVGGRKDHAGGARPGLAQGRRLPREALGLWIIRENCVRVDRLPLAVPGRAAEQDERARRLGGVGLGERHRQLPRRLPPLLRPQAEDLDGVGLAPEFERRRAAGHDHLHVSLGCRGHAAGGLHTFRGRRRHWAPSGAL